MKSNGAIGNVNIIMDVLIWLYWLFIIILLCSIVLLIGYIRSTIIE